MSLLFIITITDHIDFHTVLWNLTRGSETTSRRKIRGNFKEKVFELGHAGQVRLEFVDIFGWREGWFSQESNMILGIK